MFPTAKPREILRVSEKQYSLFPGGPVIKCLFNHLRLVLVRMSSVLGFLEYCLDCSLHHVVVKRSLSGTQLYKGTFNRFLS